VGAFAALAGLALGVGACVGQDVSVGSVGNVVNAARCHAANCDWRPTTTVLAAPAHERCSELSPLLAVEDLRVEATEGGLRELAVAPDGTIWTLHEDMNVVRTWVEHHRPDGTLIGVSEHRSLTNMTEQHLAADATSRGWVMSYVRTAASASQDYTETSTLHGYESDGTPSGPSLQFAYVAGAVLAQGPDEALTLAGSAMQNEKSGVVLRLDAAREPQWIQTLVTTDGLGVGVGVSGLVVHADGGSAVLTERARDLARDKASFGVARYRADGLLSSDTALGQPFLGGFRLALAGDPAGNLVVVGPSGSEPVGSSGAAWPLEIAEGVPASGGPGWAWELKGHVPAVTVDPESGSAFVVASDGIAIIPANGETCTLAAGIRSGLNLRELEYAGGAIYYGEQWGFGRWKLEQP
jgi:hypothetical protein